MRQRCPKEVAHFSKYRQINQVCSRYNYSSSRVKHQLLFFICQIICLRENKQNKLQSAGNYSPTSCKRLQRCERRSMSIHGDQQDSGHQDEEEENPPHPSAGHATHHSGESVNKRKGKNYVYGCRNSRLERAD